MKYPKLPGDRTYTLNLPPMNGGLNLHDAATQISDNQLTDCENMIFEDGMLRSREGIFIDPGLVSTESDQGLVHETMRYRVHPIRNDTIITEEYYYGRSFYMEEPGGSPIGEPLKYRTAFTHVSLKGGELAAGEPVIFDGAFENDGSHSLMLVPEPVANVADLTEEPEDPEEEWEEPAKERRSLVFEHDTEVVGAFNNVYALDPDSAIPFTLKDKQIYAPMVLINALPVDPYQEAGGSANGQMLEGYNLLGNRAQYFFTSDGQGIFFSIPDRLVGEIRLEYTLPGGVVVRKTFTPELNESDNSYEYEKRSPQSDYIRYSASVFGAGATLELMINVSREEPDLMALPNINRSNNIMVEGAIDRETPDTIYKMRFNTWFGGDRSSWSIGVRLFVSGNPDCPNQVYWSDTDNPLYFSENNCAGFGDASTPVTAMARQGELLVVFKERETYYVTHVAGMGVPEDPAALNAVTDVTTLEATFPVTPLHPEIGCDCPDTIQLCAGRLVWATSDGHVYVLNSMNQFNEANIVDISAGIRKKLAKIPPEELEKAVAFKHGERYNLFIPNEKRECFSFDMESSGFMSRAMGYSYSANAALVPWFYSTYSTNQIRGFLPFQEGLYAYVSEYGKEDKTGALSTVYAEMRGSVDCRLNVSESLSVSIKETPIQSMCQTKLFPFGSSDRLKEIRQAYFGLANEDDYDVEVSYVTDKGTVQEASLSPVTGIQGQESAGYISMRRLTPHVRKVSRFGIRLSCRGRFVLEGIVIKYALTGGFAR